MAMFYLLNKFSTSSYFRYFHFLVLNTSLSLSSSFLFSNIKLNEKVFQLADANAKELPISIILITWTSAGIEE